MAGYLIREGISYHSLKREAYDFSRGRMSQVRYFKSKLR
jgi:hypothetical protein